MPAVIPFQYLVKLNCALMQDCYTFTKLCYKINLAEGLQFYWVFMHMVTFGHLSSPWSFEGGWFSCYVSRSL